MSLRFVFNCCSDAKKNIKGYKNEHRFKNDTFKHMA